MNVCWYTTHSYIDIMCAGTGLLEWQGFLGIVLFGPEVEQIEHVSHVYNLPKFYLGDEI